jgi:hypothetical protein
VALSVARGCIDGFYAVCAVCKLERPGVTRRVALYPEAREASRRDYYSCPCRPCGWHYAGGVRTFLPLTSATSRPAAAASQRSPGSPATNDYRTLRASFAAIESPHTRRLWRNVGGEMGGRRHRGGGGTSLPTSTQILIMIGVLIVLVVLLGTVIFFQAR